MLDLIVRSCQNESDDGHFTSTFYDLNNKTKASCSLDFKNKKILINNQQVPKSSEFIDSILKFKNNNQKGGASLTPFNASILNTSAPMYAPIYYPDLGQNQNSPLSRFYEQYNNPVFPPDIILDENPDQSKVTQIINAMPDLIDSSLSQTSLEIKSKMDNSLILEKINLKSLFLESTNFIIYVFVTAANYINHFIQESSANIQNSYLNSTNQTANQNFDPIPIKNDEFISIQWETPKKSSFSRSSSNKDVAFKLTEPSEQLTSLMDKSVDSAYDSANAPGLLINWIKSFFTSESKTNVESFFTSFFFNNIIYKFLAGLASIMTLVSFPVSVTPLINSISSGANISSALMSSGLSLPLASLYCGNYVLDNYKKVWDKLTKSDKKTATDLLTKLKESFCLAISGIVVIKYSDSLLNYIILIYNLISSAFKYIQMQIEELTKNNTPRQEETVDTPLESGPLIPVSLGLGAGFVIGYYYSK